MKTNDLKKGARIQLRNGWFGTIQDNKKGSIRFAEVEGIYTELGSVYSHDIIVVIINDTIIIDDGTTIINTTKVIIEHTPTQLKLRQTLNTAF